MELHFIKGKESKSGWFWMEKNKVVGTESDGSFVESEP